MKKILNLSNPRLFNEKIQWLKLHDRNDRYVSMVDKCAAKKYVSSIIGDKYIIPTLGIYDSFDQINFDELPNQFVIKCTHDSGGLVIVSDKSKFDFMTAKKKINESLRKNYYYFGREWPYKGVKPGIIIEKYMGNSSNSLRDYKFFCFDGVPKIMYISDNSHTKNQSIAFFDMNFKSLDIKRKDYQSFKNKPVKPINFKKMKELSSLLSKDIPHVRIDWYEVDGRLYFGEITLYTGSGFIPFTDEKWNVKLGDLIDLSSINSK